MDLGSCIFPVLRLFACCRFSELRTADEERERDSTSVQETDLCQSGAVQCGGSRNSGSSSSSSGGGSSSSSSSTVLALVLVLVLVLVPVPDLALAPALPLDSNLPHAHQP